LGRTAKDLSAKGFRVIIPDQIGFGKSSKPHSYQFSFSSLLKIPKLFWMN
jgi:pimeloyl-ACP methyl ester carboxylesterase